MSCRIYFGNQQEERTSWSTSIIVVLLVHTLIVYTLTCEIPKQVRDDKFLLIICYTNPNLFRIKL
jgi:hypothetical protein